MKSVISLLLALLLCISLMPASASAAPAETGKNISADTEYTGTGYGSVGFLKDGDIKSYRSSKGVTLTLKNKDGIGGLYLMFDLEFGEYTVTDNDTGKTFTAGTLKMLHEYINLAKAFGHCPASVTLDFTSGSVRLSEVYALSDGTPPDFVQTWNAPLEGGADLLLFSAHGDDEQLFFAGLLPYYAVYKGYRVQVVYMTDHRNLTQVRTHEMLNGLWGVGVRAYPVFGSFPDFRIDDLEKTYDEFDRLGYPRESLQDFVVTQVRRFKPLVAVSHDLNGQYGHGMHRAFADLLTKSIPMNGDASVFPESAKKYGTWEIPKVYIHLYEKNPIVMDWDQPLDCFDGLSAFQVTQKYGYPPHESQQWTWFTRWINGTMHEITIHKATEIKEYNPCHYGLYHTTVGPDTGINDMFEHVVTYGEQERLEAERLEQERLEAERLEQERLEAERLEQQRLEQEKLEQERLEAERLEQEREQQLQEEQNAAKTKKLIIASLCLVVLVALLAGVLLKLHHPKNKKKK